MAGKIGLGGPPPVKLLSVEGKVNVDYIYTE